MESKPPSPINTITSGGTHGVESPKMCCTSKSSFAEAISQRVSFVEMFRDPALAILLDALRRVYACLKQLSMELRLLCAPIRTKKYYLCPCGRQQANIKLSFFLSHSDYLLGYHFFLAVSLPARGFGPTSRFAQGIWTVITVRRLGIQLIAMARKG